MALDLASLTPEVVTFLTERHLASLTLVRADCSPHVTPIGFTSRIEYSRRGRLRS